MLRARFTSVYVELEGGFWGLTDDQGNNYSIVNMPEQLKNNGKQFTVMLRVFDGMSMSMWGSPAEVVGFTTS